MDDLFVFLGLCRNGRMDIKLALLLNFSCVFLWEIEIGSMIKSRLDPWSNKKPSPFSNLSEKRCRFGYQRGWQGVFRWVPRLQADVEGWRYGLLVLSLRFVFKDYVAHEQQKTVWIWVVDTIESTCKWLSKPLFSTTNMSLFFSSRRKTRVICVYYDNVHIHMYIYIYNTHYIHTTEKSHIHIYCMLHLRTSLVQKACDGPRFSLWIRCGKGGGSVLKACFLFSKNLPKVGHKSGVWWWFFQYLLVKVGLFHQNLQQAFSPAC